MSDVRPFSAHVVRQASARRTVTAMTESQDDSGVDLYGVAPDLQHYDAAPPALYVYRQTRGDGETYTGVVCDVAVHAIAAGRVRAHEAVDPMRLEALLWHHARSKAAPALVMLLHRAGPVYAQAVAEARAGEPVVDFEGPGGYRQTVWRVPEPWTAALADELGATELYIADGHHRTAAALEEWRRAGEPPSAGLLCLVHPIDGLSLSAFHRRISGPIEPEQLLGLLDARFAVRRASGPSSLPVGSMNLYVGSRWYDVDLPAERPPGVAGLDVAILQSVVLDRLPPAPPGRIRTVDTVPAAEPLDVLVKRCDIDRGALFTLAPPPPEALFEISDAGEVTPPKATYFEPKPAAGIFLRR